VGISFQRDRKAVSQHLSDLVQGDPRHLVAELGAVVVPADVGREARDRGRHLPLDLRSDPPPHVLIGPVGHQAARLALCGVLLHGEEQSGPFSVPAGQKECQKGVLRGLRHGKRAVPVILRVLQVRDIPDVSGGLVDGDPVTLEVDIVPTQGKGLLAAEPAANQELQEGPLPDCEVRCADRGQLLGRQDPFLRRFVLRDGNSPAEIVNGRRTGDVEPYGILYDLPVCQLDLLAGAEVIAVLVDQDLQVLRLQPADRYLADLAEVTDRQLVHGPRGGFRLGLTNDEPVPGKIRESDVRIRAAGAAHVFNGLPIFPDEAFQVSGALF